MDNAQNEDNMYMDSYKPFNTESFQEQGCGLGSVSREPMGQLFFS